MNKNINIRIRLFCMNCVLKTLFSQNIISVI